jgi:hypothetical protein
MPKAIFLPYQVQRRQRCLRKLARSQLFQPTELDARLSSVQASVDRQVGHELAVKGAAGPMDLHLVSAVRPIGAVKINHGHQGLLVPCCVAHPVVAATFAAKYGADGLGRKQEFHEGARHGGWAIQWYGV